MFNKDIIEDFPYNATSFEEIDKGYFKSLGIPGRVWQAKEFTNLSFLPLELIKRFSDLLYRNTQILDGLRESRPPGINNNLEIALKIDTYELIEIE